MLLVRLILLTAFVALFSSPALAWSAGGRADLCGADAVASASGPDAVASASGDVPETPGSADPVADVRSPDDTDDDDASQDVVGDDLALHGAEHPGLPAVSSAEHHFPITGPSASQGFLDSLFRPPRLGR